MKNNKENAHRLDAQISNLKPTTGAAKVFNNISSFDNKFSLFKSNYIEGLTKTLNSMSSETLERLIALLMSARSKGQQIFVIGNGGSAANASHLAADLAKDRLGEQKYLFKIQSIADNVPLITAEGNDNGYENIFVNTLKRLFNPGDLLIAISSSGNSENIVRAVNYANSVNGKTFGLAGFGGGKLAQVSQACLNIPCNQGEYGFHEDACSVVIHILVDYLASLDKLDFSKKMLSSELNV